MNKINWLSKHKHNIFFNHGDINILQFWCFKKQRLTNTYHFKKCKFFEMEKYG